MSIFARVSAAYFSPPSAVSHLWEYLSHLGYISNWPVTTWGSLSYLESRLPNPLFNLFYGDIPDLTLAQKKEISALVGAVPGLWIQEEHNPQADLFSQTLSLMDPMPLQGVTFKVSDKVALRPEFLPPFVLQQISTYEELAFFDRISATCFDHEEGMLLEFMRGLSLKDDKSPLQTYLVHSDGMPIGGFQLFSYEGARGLYWGCVLPEYQEKGIGSAVLAQVLQESMALGYDHLVSPLMPSCMGILKRFTPCEKVPFRLYALSPIPSMWHQCH